LGEQCFVEYFRKLTNKRKDSNHDNWISALNYLEAFTDGKLMFKDLVVKTEAGLMPSPFFEDFKNYLLETKSKRSSKNNPFHKIQLFLIS